MGKVKIKLNKPELMGILRDFFSDDIAVRAEAIAADVRANVPKDVPVHVKHELNRSGRPVSIVTIAHPSGMARQAKHGTLTRAAAQQGLDIRRSGAK